MTIAVAEAPATRPTLKMQRTFDAPRDLVWRAWSNPEILVLWMGPVEWPAVSATCDFRVGGAWRICLRSPATGEDLWQSGIYTEIDAPRRLAFTFKWDESHEDGPPVDTQVSIDFDETADGRTVMDFTHEGLKSEQSLTGHKHGWTSTADRLEAWLAANPD
ncbi:SRPBCC family protein [Brevundimonas goettingensis]|uniref:SRPBCC domain-containing protein n=1 Tax=Brevundimonas goettingensis TaxID=2774190 RepID=A0A975C2P3_9CAUL|nr:SRPBCC domain-containing protein [Brevundimonas goettingensis]QTC92758.1 SRPBCC domain-containing protein [Brevundimonas goettingensis]